ncbi:MAG: ion transporter [Chloroflexota bacterium]
MIHYNNAGNSAPIMPIWQSHFAHIVNANWFNTLIIAFIIMAGVTVGIETYAEFASQNQEILDGLERVILSVFVLEIIIKMAAEGVRPWRYFTNPWNIFDFIIVSASLLPIGGQYLAVLRLIRILRVFKLITAIPKLQIIVGALLRSIPSMGYISLLLLLLFYIYAVLAVFIFGTNDPVHFGNLQLAMLSLFRAVTLEDWTDLMYINMYGCDQYGYGDMMELCTQPTALPIGGALFFISFIMTGALITLNFFIGVVLSSMDEVRAEAVAEEELARWAKAGKTPHDELLKLNNKLNEMQQAIQLIATSLQQKDHLPVNDYQNGSTIKQADATDGTHENLPHKHTNEHGLEVVERAEASHRYRHQEKDFPTAP